jgi:hypothetical protein
LTILVRPFFVTRFVPRERRVVVSIRSDRDVMGVELVEPAVVGGQALDPRTHKARVGIAGARSR